MILSLRDNCRGRRFFSGLLRPREQVLPRLHVDARLGERRAQVGAPVEPAEDLPVYAAAMPCHSPAVGQFEKAPKKEPAKKKDRHPNELAVRIAGEATKDR